MNSAEQAEVPKSWVTYSEAQTITGLGRTSLWKRVNAGEIQVSRIGKSVRLNRESLEAFMLRHAVKVRIPGIDDDLE